jgi:uncharacterized protein (DUF1015 family)
MVDFRAFAGWRPRTDKAEEVAAVPYDVVNTEEARALVANAPDSLLRVTRPDVDLPDGTSLYGSEAYNGAQAAFERLLSEGIIVQDSAPHFYAYAQHMGDHQQLGLVGLASAADYWADRIKKHEFTRPTKEEDRMRHIEVLRSHLGPVFMAYRAHAEIDALLASATSSTPEIDYVAPDGIRHQLWPISKEETVSALTDAFSAIDALYIADGHHRAAAASRVGRDANETDPRGHFLAVVFPDSALKILPYNRVVHHLSGRSPSELIDALKAHFELVEIDVAAEPSHRYSFAMYLDEQWYQMGLKEHALPDANDPVARLDVSVLQDLVLAPLLGVDDPRTADHIDFVGGIRGLGELARRADQTGGVAFAMPPTTLDDLMDIADAGEVMPPKSTWFEPKLRSGLVISRF